MTHFYTWPDLPQTDMVPGIRRRLVSGEKVMVVQVTMDKGAMINAHHHPHEQMTHPISGVLELEIDGETHIMRPGDVAHIPANAPHCARAIEAVVTLDIFSPPREDFLT